MSAALKESPRLDELIGTTDAARQHNFMPWDLTNAIKAGQVYTYQLPCGRDAYRRDEVDASAADLRRENRE